MPDGRKDAGLHQGSAEEPAVYGLRRASGGWEFSRREFLAAAAAVCLARPAWAATDPADAVRWAHRRNIWALAFSPDGRLLVSGAVWEKDNDALKFWSLPDGAHLRTLDLGSPPADPRLLRDLTVNYLAISPDGKVLASGHHDSTVRLWSMPAGQLLQTLSSASPPKADRLIHTAAEKPAHFSNDALLMSPDGRMLAAGGRDQTTDVFELPGGAVVRRFAAGEPLGFSPDGKLLVTRMAHYQGRTTTSSIDLRSLPDGALVKSFAQEAGTGCLAMSRDMKLLVTSDDASHSGTVKVWSLTSGECLTTIKAHRELVSQLVISPNGKLLVSLSAQWAYDTGAGTAKVWSLPDGAPLGTLELAAARIHAVAISADSRLLATGGCDRMIRLWSLPEGKLVQRLVDVAASPPAGTVRQYRYADQEVPVYTVYPTVPLPKGARCTCDSVPGAYTAWSAGSSGGEGSGCACVPVQAHGRGGYCICVPVSY